MGRRFELWLLRVKQRSGYAFKENDVATDCLRYALALKCYQDFLHAKLKAQWDVKGAQVPRQNFLAVGVRDLVVPEVSLLVIQLYLVCGEVITLARYLPKTEVASIARVGAKEAV